MLFGPEFTAADISAFILMFRLDYIGIGSRYFSAAVRPEVFGYYQRVMQRPAVVQTLAVVNNAAIIHMKMALKSIGMKAVKVGLVVGLIGLAYVGYKKFGRGSR